MTHRVTRSLPQNFVESEDGAATPLAIYFTLILLVMGGLAIDFQKATSDRLQLQVATDTAAHAALYTREFETREASVEVAIDTINGMLPEAAFGTTALVSSDVEFGVWDENVNAFSSDPASRSAVRVIAQMNEGRANASTNILLSIIGFDTFDIDASTVYTTYFPPCFTEGFVAEDVVDLQSNNSFTDGFCIHSNAYVSLNQNNYFEPGTVVSMPDLANLDIPKSGFEKNDGLQTALRSGEYRMRLLSQLEDKINSLYSGDPTHASMAGVTSNLPTLTPIEPPKGTQPWSTSPKTSLQMGSSTGKKMYEPASFPLKNRIYRADCSGNGDITFKPGTYTDFALVTNCVINFSNGVILDGTVLATTNVDIKSVTASHVQMGLDDNCAEGGGSIIMTLGGFEAASGLQGYGAQILAKKDIQFAAQASGIEGVSFISGGSISGTSGSSMGYCDEQGTDDFIRAPYFRMVD
jgi:Flp pilus assembly protein TadG